MTVLIGPFAVVLDACVLYPMPMCDTLLRLANAGLYQPRWSAHILAEAHRNLVADGRSTPEAAARRQALMETMFPEAMVTGHEPLIAAMPNHEKDRHVAAVAVKAGAELIVTSNLTDFTPLPPGIDVLAPDDFLCDLLDLDRAATVAALRAQAAALRRPPQSLDELLDKLGARGAPRFAAAMRATHGVAMVPGRPD